VTSNSRKSDDRKNRYLDCTATLKTAWLILLCHSCVLNRLKSTDEIRRKTNQVTKYRWQSSRLRNQCTAATNDWKTVAVAETRWQMLRIADAALQKSTTPSDTCTQCVNYCTHYVARSEANINAQVTGRGTEIGVV